MYKPRFLITALFPCPHFTLAEGLGDWKVLASNPRPHPRAAPSSLFMLITYTRRRSQIVAAGTAGSSIQYTLFIRRLPLLLTRNSTKETHSFPRMLPAPCARPASWCFQLLLQTLALGALNDYNNENRCFPLA